MKTKSLKEPALSSPIEEKIAWAEAQFKACKNRLTHDARILDPLQSLKAAIEASHMEMVRTGLMDLCRVCDEKEGGSCCGAGLENRYDGWLLLINLLLGADLPKKRIDPGSCFFLGKSGCLLQARHTICINYACSKITEHIPPQKMAALREKEGTEIHCLFLLNERIKRLLRG